MTSNPSRLFLLLTLTAALVMAAAPTAAEAQRRFRRPARAVVIGGYGYYPYGYSSPWFQRGPWGPYGYPGYRYGVFDSSASLRVDAEPRQAQVFVDGYYAGLVDDFDGIFQRLRVEPGGRTITLFLEGYRTEQQHLYLRPATDQRIRMTMQPLAAGEQSVPPLPPSPGEETDGGPYDAAPQGLPPGAGARDLPVPDVRAPSVRFGTLALRVQPAGADVYVDGEPWSGTTDAGRVDIELPEGRHHIEVRLAGMTTYSEDVLIRRDRTLTLNVSLSDG